MMSVRAVKRTVCRTVWLTLLMSVAWIGLPSSPSAIVAEDEAVLTRVSEDIRVLSADEMEGRGPGTQGLEQAGDYVRDEFRRLGLKSGPADGSYRQPFEVSVGSRIVAASTSLTLRGPDGQAWKLELGRDFQALAVGGSGRVQGPLVFAGYGISAAKLSYDDFDGLDTEGKILLVIRREPQQGDANSKFDGTHVTPHSLVNTKLQKAKERKAAAVLMVNDPFTTTAEGRDPLAPPAAFGSGAAGIPFAQVTQAVADKLLAAAPLQAAPETKLTSVAAVAKQIDDTLRTVSQPLPGWSAELECTFEKAVADTANIVGVLEAAGPLSQETIVLGAHYDHIGHGEFGSRKRDSSETHNGADDNATGTAAVMELARRMVRRGQPPARRLVFVAFSGEERGLVGSKFYVDHPLFPLADTVTMLNFDMVGRLRNDELTVFGARSAAELDEFLDRAGVEVALKLKKDDGTRANGDHFPFYQRGIPALHFFTGMTNEYHTPDDDFVTINMPGVVRTIDFAERVLDHVLTLPRRPEFVKSEKPAAGPARTTYLGVTLDGAAGSDGLKINAVAANSPAAQGGLQPGDVILQFGDSTVADVRTLMDGLQKRKPGDIVNIQIRRQQQPVTCTVTLGRPQGG